MFLNIIYFLGLKYRHTNINTSSTATVAFKGRLNDHQTNDVIKYITRLSILNKFHIYMYAWIFLSYPSDFKGIISHYKEVRPDTS